MLALDFASLYLNSIRGSPKALFDLRAPAAMLRAQHGKLELSHGSQIPYTAIWDNPEWRNFPRVPLQEQACGINSGVMLLEPK